jgi:HPt (histidine-containing phosphotransfer) domain-containing protein
MSHAYAAIDPSELFAASGHDLALFRSLSQIFLDTAPSMLERMRQTAHCAPDASATAFIAASHTLRGIAALVGARTLTAMLTELEAQAHRGACPTGAALLPAGGALAAVCSEVAYSITAYPDAAP